MEKLNKWASSQDGGLSRYASFLHTTKMKDNNQFKNKKQPKLSENQTVWNSNNQGVKETVIQTGRRGRDVYNKAIAERWNFPHCGISQEEQQGSKTDCIAQGYSMGN